MTLSEWLDRRVQANTQRGAASLYEGRKTYPEVNAAHAFDKAAKDAELKDFQFRDFRHCARTRWAAMGLPFEVGEIGIGHNLRGIAGRYVNLSDEQIRDAFEQMFHRITAVTNGQTSKLQQN